MPSLRARLALRPVTSWLCCWGYNTLPGPHRPRPVKKHICPWGRCLVGNVGRGDLYPFFERLLPLVWGFCGNLAPPILPVTSADGLATELEPLCISVCEALLAFKRGCLLVSPTGFSLWALPTEVVLWTPSVVSGGSAEFWPAVLGLWILPTGVGVIVWAPSLEVPWWASSILNFSWLLSLFPKPSSLCCRDALSWRSLLMTSPNLAFSSLTVRLRLIKSAWLMATVCAYEMCCSGVEAWSGSVLVVAGVCCTCSEHQQLRLSLCLDLESSFFCHKSGTIHAGGWVWTFTVQAFGVVKVRACILAVARGSAC